MDCTHDEQHIELPSSRLHGYTGHLADHRVERKRYHARDRHTLRTRLGVEDLSGDDPG